jgi:hypothetical protein
MRQNVTDKMSRTKCHQDKMSSDKMSWTKCHGQNVVDKMSRTKCHRQMSWTECRGHTALIEEAEPVLKFVEYTISWHIKDIKDKAKAEANENLPRSNHSVEGWHNAFNNVVGSAHPTTTKLTRKLP